MKRMKRRMEWNVCWIDDDHNNDDDDKEEDEEDDDNDNDKKELVDCDCNLYWYEKKRKKEKERKSNDRESDPNFIIMKDENEDGINDWVVRIRSQSLLKKKGKKKIIFVLVMLCMAIDKLWFIYYL